VQLNKVVITDSSCFIILDKINALHILDNLFSVVITTPEIAAEYGQPLPEWVHIEAPKNIARKLQLNKLIDPGEASALALAYEIDCDYLILDDLEARKLAEKLGLQIKGTVGIIVLAKQQGIVQLIKPYLEKIQLTNFRLSNKVVEKALKDAGE
jgi:predicted nucleic acid-binding protein